MEYKQAVDILNGRYESLAIFDSEENNVIESTHVADAASTRNSYVADRGDSNVSNASRDVCLSPNNVYYPDCASVLLACSSVSDSFSAASDFEDKVVDDFLFETMLMLEDLEANEEAKALLVVLADQI
jgi:hypothetical protein